MKKNSHKMWDSGNKLQNHAVAVTRFMLCAREEASYNQFLYEDDN